MNGLLAASGAIILWSLFASLAVLLGDLPPLFLTGSALTIGGLSLLPFYRQWRVSKVTYITGVSALLVYHVLLIFALRMAPPVPVILVNDLWPLLIVVLSPVMIPGMQLQRRHIVAALLGFAGAATAVISSKGISESKSDIIFTLPLSLAPIVPGYFMAMSAALIWAWYSLRLRSLPTFSSFANGGFCLTAGLIALLFSYATEAWPELSVRQFVLLITLGAGPMGMAFVLWDRAMKFADPRQVGVLSNATPLLATLLLLQVTGARMTALLGLATVLIVGATALASRSGK